MKQHTAEVAASCYYHPCRVRQVHRGVDGEVVTRLVFALIVSRIDYGNSVLAGLPQSTIAPLYNGYRTPLIAWSSSSAHASMSPSVFFSCTGFRSAGESSSSYAVLCTSSFTGGVPSGLPIQHREACRPQSFTRRPTIFFSNELCDAAATDKMWRARLFSRWPCRVRRSTGRHACCL